MRQVMKLDATQATVHSLTLNTLLHIKAHGETIFQSAGHQQAAPTIENSCLWMVDQDVGFIMLSTWPLSTWNTQVLWLLQPPWHELSIRPFESNSLARLCHLYFHNCLDSWFWGALSDRSVLPRLTSSLVSWDKEIYTVLVKYCMHSQLSIILLIYKLSCSKAIESNQRVIEKCFDV